MRLQESNVKTVLLIGLGRFGRHIAMELYNLGHQIMAVDSVEDRVNAVLPYVTNAQIGDSTKIEFLSSLGIPDYDVCIVAIGSNFQSSLETTSYLKELGAKKVVSRASRDIQAKFLLKNGADAVVYPEKQLARWTAVRYTADHILDFIELDDDHSIFEIAAPRQWCSKTIKDLDLRRKYDINILGIRENGRMNVIITPNIVIHSGMTLLVLGDYNKLKKCNCL